MLCQLCDLLCVPTLRVRLGQLARVRLQQIISELLRLLTHLRKHWPPGQLPLLLGLGLLLLLGLLGLLGLGRGLLGLRLLLLGLLLQLLLQLKHLLLQFQRPLHGFEQQLHAPPTVLLLHLLQLPPLLLVLLQLPPRLLRTSSHQTLQLSHGFSARAHMEGKVLQEGIEGRGGIHSNTSRAPEPVPLRITRTYLDYVNRGHAAPTPACSPACMRAHACVRAGAAQVQVRSQPAC